MLETIALTLKLLLQMFSEYETEIMVSFSDYMKLDIGLNNLFILSLTVITFGPNFQITAFKYYR